jgi:glycerophosphoryl diester phosphodiesterase
MTKDGYLVVTHDEEISRVSDGSGYVKDYTFQELRCFQFNRTHPEYEDIKIPLFEDVLEQFKPQNDFLFNIELKNNIFSYEGMEEKILNVVKEKGVLERTLFSSFYHNSLLSLRELDFNTKIAFLYCDGFLNVPDYAKKYTVDAVHPAWYLLDRDDMFLSRKKTGIEVNVGTVDSGKEIRRLCDMGVNGIITNKPDLESEIRDDGRTVYQ